MAGDTRSFASFWYHSRSLPSKKENWRLDSNDPIIISIMMGSPPILFFRREFRIRHFIFFPAGAGRFRYFFFRKKIGTPFFRKKIKIFRAPSRWRAPGQSQGASPKKTPYKIHLNRNK
uniref:hypothetical protein n=1 Tax=Cephaleuros karstenii TaxID=1985640 RepID=UPI001EDEF123|nr:hypothetical protein MFR52_pgp014 [Cephaleuros karstenii]UIB39145.1 hypothetical protein [Cephaleuros karstenii]